MKGEGNVRIGVKTKHTKGKRKEDEQHAKGKGNVDVWYTHLPIDGLRDKYTKE